MTGTVDAGTPVVAQVRIDSPLPQLDRPFDYAIPASLDGQVAFGSRVRVRFSGRLVTGFVVGLSTSSEREGLRSIERVLGPEPVLRPEILNLAEAVAERYAGTVWDVLRAAIPPRHARAEAAGRPASHASEPTTATTVTTTTAAATGLDQACWSRYRYGSAMLARIANASAGNVRAAWSCAPLGKWPAEISEVIRAVLAQPSGGIIVIVPDAWDVQRVSEEIADLTEHVSVLTADLGPERRYRAFLRVLRGSARVVIGTRAAVFAPLPDCRAVVVWNDGDDALWDPQAPYWNARDVAAIRSHLTGCALLVGSGSRSTQVQAWCQSGWARSLDPLRAEIRSSGPVIRGISGSADADDAVGAGARIPHLAWLVAQEGLRTGPVLVQVSRRGYLPAVACQQCRITARCSCGGPLSVAAGSGPPGCTWCGALASDWHCQTCGSSRLRAVRVGVERTAEEFGRAFPGASVIWSSADGQRRTVTSQPCLVIATPGSEPVADGGYAAVVILDARAALARPWLRAGEDAVHRWFSAAMLARPKAQVVVAADQGSPAVQGLVRWDASWFAERELAERSAAGLPPATRIAALYGPDQDVAAVVGGLTSPHRLLGPVEGRLLVAVDRSDGSRLASELRAITRTRAMKSAPAVRVVLDPRDL